MDTEVKFSIKAYSKKELTNLYNVSLPTFNRWLNMITDLGEYLGKKYTPAQVQKIVSHLGTP